MRLLKTFVIYAILLTFMCSGTNAQNARVQNLSRFDDKPMHFGFFLGVNTMDFRISQYTDVLQNPLLQEPENTDLADRVKELYGYDNSQTDSISIQAGLNPLSPGFTVGIVSDFRLSDALSFRATPGMSFGNRNFKYNISIDEDILRNIGDNGVDEPSYLAVPSTFIDCPVGFRYYGKRFGNTKPYIYLGGTYRLDLASTKNANYVVHLKKHGAYLDIATGLNSYLQYFRFTTELRVSLGLNNIINHNVGDLNSQPPYYGYIIEELRSNVFSLIFYFE